MLRRVLLLATAALALSASPAAAACTGANTVPVGESGRQQALKTVFCLVNAERAKVGRAALRRSGLLAGVAQRQSADMVRYKYVGHVSHSGQTIRTRVARAGYRARYSGEAIGWATGAERTPAGLMRRVMTTAAHRKAVLGAKYRDLGVGLVLAAPQGNRSDAGTLTLTIGRRR